MGKKRLQRILAAATVLLAVTLGAASPLPAATLTCPDAVRPGALATATLRLTGEAISGVSFTLQESENLTLNACYVLTPGWTMDSSGARYAAHSTASPVQALDIMISLTVESLAPGEAVSLTVDDLTLSDGRADARLPALVWRSVFLPSRGDLNGDSTADIRDVQCLYDYLCHGALPPAFAGDEALFRSRTDLDGSGAVDVLDYQLLWQLLLP